MNQYIYTKLGNKIEAYRLGGKFYDKDFDKLNIPEKSLIITDVTGPICLYKYVKKTGGKYVSYYKNGFEYKIRRGHRRKGESKRHLFGHNSKTICKKPPFMREMTTAPAIEVNRKPPKI